MPSGETAIACAVNNLPAPPIWNGARSGHMKFRATNVAINFFAAAVLAGLLRIALDKCATAIAERSSSRSFPANRKSSSLRVSLAFNFSSLCFCAVCLACDSSSLC